MQNTHHNCLQAKKSCMKSYLNNLSIIALKLNYAPDNQLDNNNLLTNTSYVWTVDF